MVPSSLLFALSTITGTLIVLSSSNWLFLWMGMELNLLAFVPLITTSNNLQETEASVKYFIVQAIGSGLMLTAGIMSMNPLNHHMITSITPTLFITSMLIKLGMAPFHQWLPHVMSSIPWTTCMLLATWQKISPLTMIVFIAPKTELLTICFIAGMNTLIGGIGGISQSQLRALMAYSSIGHMGWIIMTTQCSTNTFIMYFTMYIIMNLALMSIMTINSNMHSKFSNSITSMNSMMFLMLMAILFSLSGLPPFMGFIPKWMVINHLANLNMTVLIPLITGSLINMFFYFNMVFNFMMTQPHARQTKKVPHIATIMTIMSTFPSLVTLL